MTRLSARDASFLYSDTTHSNANVSLLHIYDQSTVPGGTLRFKTLLAHIESRLDRSPVFRRRLQRVPLELDYPYWVEDPNFDLEYHVRHIALPKPGDWRQFCIQVSRIHARPLDLARPLWEIYVIEGLDSLLDLPAGSFALLTKTHHAAVDPASGSELTALLHDTGPAPPPAAPPAPWFAPRTPGAAAMLWRGAFRSLAAPLRLARPLSRVLARWAPQAFVPRGAPRPAAVPLTRFNAVVSPHRVFETRRFELDQFERIRALARGATLSDAVLAVCGGALRRYLGAQGELPDASLTALAPSLAPGDAERAHLERGNGKHGSAKRSAARSDTERAGSGREGLAWRQVQLGTQIADPAARLAFVRAQTAVLHSAERRAAAQELSAIEAHMPAATLALSGKMLGLASLGIGRRRALANCSMANVPGPAAPLYLCGARMTYFSAIMPIADGMGLAFAITSYDGQLIVSPTSCRELMPDPGFFAQCLRESFQEALGAALRIADPPAPRKARPRRASEAAPARAAAAGRKRAPAQAAAAANTAARALRSAPPRASRAGKAPPKARRG